MLSRLFEPYVCSLLAEPRGPAYFYSQGHTLRNVVQRVHQCQVLLTPLRALLRDWLGYWFECVALSIRERCRQMSCLRPHNLCDEPHIRVITKPIPHLTPLFLGDMVMMDGFSASYAIGPVRYAPR